MAESVEESFYTAVGGDDTNNAASKLILENDEIEDDDGEHLTHAKTNTSSSTSSGLVNMPNNNNSNNNNNNNNYRSSSISFNIATVEEFSNNEAKQPINNNSSSENDDGTAQPLVRFSNANNGAGGGGGTADQITPRGKRKAIQTLKPLESIDWDAMQERQRRKRLLKEKGVIGALKRFFYSTQGWILITLVALTSGLVAGFIDVVGVWLYDLRKGTCGPYWWISRERCCSGIEDREECHDWMTWAELMGLNKAWAENLVDFHLYLVASVFIAVATALLCKNFSPYAGGGGIPEVKTILGGFVIPKYLGFWTLLTKTIGLIGTVGSGLVLGMEGPMVHICCCVGNVWCRIFQKYKQNEGKKMEVLSASCAIAIAVAFGAPIGGVLFSLEEMSSYFPHKTMWRSLFGAVIGAITLKLVNPHSLALLRITYNAPFAWWELIPFAFIGIAGGLLGAAFASVGVRLTRFRKASIISKWPVTEVFVVATLTSIVSFWMEFTLMGPKALLELMFHECPGNTPIKTALCNLEWKPLVLLAIAFVFKCIAIVFSFGLKVPAGLFVPSLTVGAMMGHLVGSFVSFLHGELTTCHEGVDCIIPGVYAMIGAATTLAGVSRSTVSVTVIMFEITGGLNYIVPIMLAVLMAKWTGDIFGKESIFERLIQLNGYPYLDNKIEIDLEGVAREMMTPLKYLQVINVTGHTVESLQQLLEANQDFNGYPIVSPEGTIYGYINASELRKFLYDNSGYPGVHSGAGLKGNTRVVFSKYLKKDNETVNLSHLVDKNPIVIHGGTPLDRVFQLFKSLALKYCLVARESKLVGLITKKDVLNYLVVLEEEHKAKNHSGSGGGGGSWFFNLFSLFKKGGGKKRGGGGGGGGHSNHDDLNAHLMQDHDDIEGDYDMFYDKDDDDNDRDDGRYNEVARRSVTNLYGGGGGAGGASSSGSSSSSDPRRASIKSGFPFT